MLMTNHVHLLTTPQTADSLPRVMRSLGRRYVRHINTPYKRTGTLWEGRYRAAPIDGESTFDSGPQFRPDCRGYRSISTIAVRHSRRCSSQQHPERRQGSFLKHSWRQLFTPCGLERPPASVELPAMH
jgi:hypothetical protein